MAETKVRSNGGQAVNGLALGAGPVRLVAESTA